MKFLFTFATATFGVLLFSPAYATDGPKPGCYVPVRGHAASICTDPECTNQQGVYFFTLKSPRHKVKLTGTFKGTIIEFPNDCRGSTLSHLFMDKEYTGTINSSGDEGCPIGGDGITTLKIRETLHLIGGTGIYSGLEAGGSVVLIGNIGLQTGINTFKVVKGEGEVCFIENE